MHKNQKNFDLLPVKDADQEFLRALYDDVHTPEFYPLGLPAEALEQLLAMQFRAQTTGFATQFPNAVHSIVWMDKERIGRVLVAHDGEHLHLADISLLTTFRGAGLGTRILEGVIATATRRGLTLDLIVRFDNPARRLYERLGFVSIGNGDGLHLPMQYNTAGAQSTNASQTSSMDEVPIVAGSSSSYFRTLLGKSIFATGPDKIAVMLELFAVEPLSTNRLFRNAGRCGGDSFTLRFRGPHTPVLPSDTLDFETEAGECFSLCLAPVEQNETGIEYNAVFNRLES